MKQRSKSHGQTGDIVDGAAGLAWLNFNNTGLSDIALQTVSLMHADDPGKVEATGGRQGPHAAATNPAREVADVDGT